MPPYNPIDRQIFDTVVYGSTPGGIVAAIAAARDGAKTVLVSSSRNIGGMSSSGLCTTDAVRRDAFGGIMLEFVENVHAYYREHHAADSETMRRCQNGWWYEPHVAEQAFCQLLEKESNITIHLECGLEGVHLQLAHRISSIRIRTGEGTQFTLVGKTFIDASYEADLAAMAGVPCRVAREGRETYGESLAGVTYFDWKSGKLLGASSGEAHPGIQSYCFRHTLTDFPPNQVRVCKPEAYEDFLPGFLPILADIASGRVKTMEDVTMTNPLPNRKLDANGQIEGLTSFNLPGENWNYPEAKPEARAAIIKRHRVHAHGLLYFMQNDWRVAAPIREEFNRWHFCADEYTDNEHQPWQLYIRQARRIVGRVTLTQHDYCFDPLTGLTPHHADSIAVAEHSFDIHPCQNRSAAREGLMEGVLWFPDKAAGPAQPGQVPFRAMLPEHISNLLVPVGLSATHVAFSVLRMEPVWMATGQAAGFAAALASKNDIDAADINVPTLQARLRSCGQCIDYRAKTSYA